MHNAWLDITTHLVRQNIETTRPSNKLDYVKLGSF